MQCLCQCFDAAKSSDVEHCSSRHSCRKLGWKQFLSESVDIDKQLHLSVAPAKQKVSGGLSLNLQPVLQAVLLMLYNDIDSLSQLRCQEGSD